MKNKKCSTCREIKPLIDFGKDKTKKDGLNISCKLCLNIRAQKFREENRDSIREAAVKYRSENKEKVLQSVTASRKKRPEVYKKHAERCREKNKEAIKESYKKWKDANPSYFITYRKENVITIKRKNQRYRARVRGGGELPKATVQMVYKDNIKHFGVLTCYLCLKPIPFGKDHLEHKLPLSRGGTNHYDNLGVACQFCNIQKHTKTVEEYLCKRTS